MRCPVCGKELADENARICEYCDSIIARDGFSEASSHADPARKKEAYTKESTRTRLSDEDAVSKSPNKLRKIAFKWALIGAFVLLVCIIAHLAYQINMQSIAYDMQAQELQDELSKLQIALSSENLGRASDNFFLLEDGRIPNGVLFLEKDSTPASIGIYYKFRENEKSISVSQDLGYTVEIEDSPSLLGDHVTLFIFTPRETGVSSVSFTNDMGESFKLICIVTE